MLRFPAVPPGPPGTAGRSPFRLPWSSPPWVLLSVACLPAVGWSFFNVGGTFSFTASYLVAMLVILQAAGSLLATTRPSPAGDGPDAWKPYWSLVAAFALPLAISGLTVFLNPHGSFVRYLSSLAHLVFFFAFLAGLYRLPRKEEAIRFMFAAYVGAAVLVSLFALYQIYALVVLRRPVFLSFTIATGVTQAESGFLGFPRIASVFLEPGWLAHFNTMALIILFAWAMPRWRSLAPERSRWPLWLAAGIIVAATLITLSATAYLVILGVVVFARLMRGARISGLLIWMAILLGTLLALAKAPMPGDLPNPLGVMLDRFTGLLTGHWVSGESAASRSAEMAVGLNMAQESWLLGIGFGQSAPFLVTRNVVGTLGISSFYLAVLAELGLAGLVLIPAALVWLHLLLARRHRRIPAGDPLHPVLTTVRCLFLADCLFLNFFGNFVSAKYFMTLWLVLATLQASRSRLQGGHP